MSKELRLELRNKHVASRGVIPLVGAGSSILLDIPGWEELVRLYHIETNCALDFDELCKKNGYDWPKITDAIFALTENNFDGYFDFLKKVVVPRASGFHELPAIIVKYFDQIITTNFDSVFDNVFEYNAPAVIAHRTMSYPQINALDFHGKVIAYLHGKVSDRSVVFKESEYVTAYENAAIRTLLGEIIKKKSLLFIGFSFQDEVIYCRIKRQIKTQQ